MRLQIVADGSGKQRQRVKRERRQAGRIRQKLVVEPPVSVATSRRSASHSSAGSEPSLPASMIEQVAALVRRDRGDLLRAIPGGHDWRGRQCSSLRGGDVPGRHRKSFDGLAEVVRAFLGHDPLSGSMFVFRSRSAERVKILWWDRDGLAIYYKRLEKAARSSFLSAMRRQIAGHLQCRIDEAVVRLRDQVRR